MSRKPVIDTARGNGDREVDGTDSETDGPTRLLPADDGTTDPSTAVPGTADLDAAVVGAADLDAADVDALRRELARQVEGQRPSRWDADPEEARRSVLRLVLALAEFLRALMERQAIRRMEDGTLDDEEIEAVGTALMRLEETIHDLAREFDLDPADLNLDLGPLGRLL